MSEVPLLAVEELEVRYDAVRAVRGVSIEVREGELVALLGANGAGKSSFLGAVTGLVPPQSGRILLRGEDVTGRSPEAMLARGVSLVPEGRRVFAKLSVADNLRLGAATRKDRSAARHDQAEMIERFPILGKRRRQMAGTLSGGEQQMLAIARALVARPQLLLLDEPSLGLAPIIVTEVLDLVEQLRREGRTILLVEQNAHQALRIADRSYVMQTGRLHGGGAVGSEAEIDQVERAYLGLEVTA